MGLDDIELFLVALVQLDTLNDLTKDVLRVTVVNKMKLYSGVLIVINWVLRGNRSNPRAARSYHLVGNFHHQSSHIVLRTVVLSHLVHHFQRLHQVPNHQRHLSWLIRVQRVEDICDLSQILKVIFRLVCVLLDSLLHEVPSLDHVRTCVFQYLKSAVNPVNIAHLHLNVVVACHLGSPVHLLCLRSGLIVLNSHLLRLDQIELHLIANGRDVVVKAFHYFWAVLAKL